MALISDLRRDPVDAADRLRRPRVQAPAGLAIAVATAAAVAAVVLLVADDGGEPDSAPADRVLPAPSPERSTTDLPTKAPPRPSMEPVPGSASPPLDFNFDGLTYSATRFRSDGSLICTTLKPSAGTSVCPPPAGAASASACCVMYWRSAAATCTRRRGLAIRDRRLRAR